MKQGYCVSWTSWLLRRQRKWQNRNWEYYSTIVLYCQKYSLTCLHSYMNLSDIPFWIGNFWPFLTHLTDVGWEDQALSLRSNSTQRLKYRVQVRTLCRQTVNRGTFAIFFTSISCVVPNISHFDYQIYQSTKDICWSLRFSWLHDYWILTETSFHSLTSSLLLLSEWTWGRALWDPGCGRRDPAGSREAGGVGSSSAGAEEPPHSTGWSLHNATALRGGPHPGALELPLVPHPAANDRRYCSRYGLLSQNSTWFGQMDP